MSTKSVLMLVTDGSEEIECVVSIDLLRRAKSNVTVASVAVGDRTEVTCSRNVKLVADTTLAQVKHQQFDAVVLPGGLNGAKAMAANEDVISLVKSYHEAGRLVAAICAGPTVFAAANIAAGAKITSYPSVKAHFAGKYEYSEERVVVSDNMITSRGPATSFEFALSIVKYLHGPEVVDKLADAILFVN